MSRLAYFKLAADHPDYAAALAVLKTEFAQVHPGNEMSVNVNAAGTLAWVKAPADADCPDGPLLATCQLSDVERVRAEVSDESWTGQRAQRGPRGRP